MVLFMIHVAQHPAYYKAGLEPLNLPMFVKVNRNAMEIFCMVFIAGFFLQVIQTVYSLAMILIESV